MKPKQPKPHTMIPAKTKSKPKPVVLSTWYEANTNGGLVKIYSVQCQVCGGIIPRTPRKNTTHHMECRLKGDWEKNSEELLKSIRRMKPQEKERVLLHALEELQNYKNRYGLLIGKDHVDSSHALIRAIADEGRYEKLNMIAGEWLSGE